MNTAFPETPTFRQHLIDFDRAVRAIKSLDSLTDMLGSMEAMSAGVLSPDNLSTLLNLLSRELRQSLNADE